MRLLLLALALTAPLLLAPAAPRCDFCVQTTCQVSSMCGHGCFCLKQGDDWEGLCYSTGLAQ